MTELIKLSALLIFLIVLINLILKKPKQKPFDNKYKTIYKKQPKSNKNITYIESCWNEIEKHK